MELLEVHVCHACLLHKLSHGALVGRLVYLQETAGECPHSFEGFYASFDEQDMELAPVESEHHGIGGDGRMGYLYLYAKSSIVMHCVENTLQGYCRLSRLPDFSDVKFCHVPIAYCRPLKYVDGFIKKVKIFMA